MTKYILHGGRAQDPNAENDKFFEEILDSTSTNPQILLVHFAGKPEKAEQNWQRDTSQFERVKGNKTLNFKLATIDGFENQVQNADVLYLGGGTTVKLLDELKDFNNLTELFKDKIIAGESAGANVLATFCYSKSGGGVFKTLGILPVKTYPHYEGSGEEELEAVGEGLELLLLREYQFKVFEV